MYRNGQTPYEGYFQASIIEYTFLNKDNVDFNICGKLI